MELILWISFIVLALCACLAVFGKSIWIRLLGLSLVSSKVLIIIVAFASHYNQRFLMDLAIIYALSNFIGTIFLTLFILERSGGKRGAKWKS